MKKLLAVSAVVALGLSSVGFAGGLPEEMPVAPAAISTSDAGIYMGLAGGYGMTNWKNFDKSVSVSKDNGFVGRAFLGYDIVRNFAVEAGYSYFFNKVEFDKVQNVKSTQAIDLMLKLKAPVVDGFDLFAKVGGNYLMTNFKDKHDNVKNFNVAYGVGADYSITPNIIASVEWLRFNGKAKIDNEKYQPNTDAFLIGLRYKFDL